MPVHNHFGADRFAVRAMIAGTDAGSPLGPVARGQLALLGIKTMSDVARCPEDVLMKKLGKEPKTAAGPESGT